MFQGLLTDDQQARNGRELGLGRRHPQAVGAHILVCMPENGSGRVDVRLSRTVDIVN